MDEFPVTDRLRRFAITVWAIIGGLLLGAAVVWLFAQVRVIWLPLVFAGGMVVLLEPVVKALRRLSFPRVLAVTGAFVMLAVTLAAIGSLIVPTVREQASEFGASIPDLVDEAVVWVNDVGDKIGIDLGSYLDADKIRAWVSDPANQDSLQSLIDGFGTGAGRVIRGVAEFIAVLFLAPIFAFYLLVDLDRTRKLFLELTPPRVREEVQFVASNVGAALGGFVRGQLVVALVVGVLSSLALWLLGLPFWLIIGIAAGLLNLVPFIGPFVGGALALMVAVLQGELTKGLIAVAAFTVIQQLDNHIITPLVQRTRVRLSPLVIVLSLIVGGAVAGLLGVVVAVPLVASIRIVLGHVWRTRMLGESWHQASEAMIEVTPAPDRLRPIRRPRDQTRLFDTAELSALDDANGGDKPDPGTESPDLAGESGSRR